MTLPHEIMSVQNAALAATALVVGLFALGTVMNAISRSRKERVMAFVALVLGALSLVIARGPV